MTIFATFSSFAQGKGAESILRFKSMDNFYSNYKGFTRQEQHEHSAGAGQGRKAESPDRKAI